MTNDEGMTMLDGARERLKEAVPLNDFGNADARMMDDIDALLTSEAAYKVRVEELTERLLRAEVSLLVYDEGGVSEYWVRYPSPERPDR